MRKTIRITCALTVVLLGLAFINTQPVKAADYCVNPGGTSGCFDSIQAAIDEADNGDTIHVEPGDYTGNLVINKTIALLGDDQVDIIGGDGPISHNIKGEDGSDTIRITAGGVLIRGFTIWQYQTTTGEYAAIRITNVNQATVYDTFIDSQDMGIVISNSSLVYIYDNGIYANHISLDLASAGVVIHHNIVERSVFAGIYAEVNSNNNEVTDNIIRNNTGNGIYVENSNGYNISNNEITDNGQNGIELFGSKSNLIEWNTLWGNLNDGIYIHQTGATGTASPNYIHRNNFNNGQKNISVESGVATIDSERNWWGSPGTVDFIDKIEGDADYSPWCINETCTAIAIHNVTMNTYHENLFLAVADAGDSNVIQIEAGTYVEDPIVIERPIDIGGAGQNETLILLNFYPDQLPPDPDCDGIGSARICDGGFNFFLVTADGVNIHDLTIDGNNPGILSGVTIGGVDIDVRNGIIGNTLAGDYDITVNNVTAKNLYMTGIMSTGSGSIFTHNTVTNVRGDPQSVGIGGSPVQVHGNAVSSATLGVVLDSGDDAVIDGNSITNSNAGIISMNSCAGAGCTTGEQITNNTVSDCTGTTGWGIVVSANHDDVNVEGNQVLRCKVGFTASGGQTTAPVTFVDNTVTAPASPAGSFGVYLSTNQIIAGTGNVYANFTDNSISGFATGVYLYDPNHLVIQTAFLHNQLANNTMQVNVGSVGTIASSFEQNWWGHASGPATGSVYTGLDFTPWCGNAGCSVLVPSGGIIEIPAATEGTYVQRYLNNAPENTEIRFLGSPGPLAGGFSINTPHLTILLRNGVVIQNNSPCFVINADYTTIKTESVGGASCIPTSSSNGITVTAPRVNTVIQGIEFPGATGTDGIHFNGAITDTVLVNNWFHNLAGDGIEFVSQPTGVINIQGNLFQNNGGFGINSPGSVDAEFNSWGDAGGASTGDGASSGVTTNPYTHVDLYTVSTGTPRTGQVLTGQTITYTVYAHMVNALAVDFWLQYPTELTLLGSPENSGVFESYAYFDTSIANFIHFYGLAAWDESYGSGGGFRPVTGTVPIYSVTFTAGDPISGAVLNLNDLNDKFAMETYESSNNIYAAALVDGPVDVLDSYTATGTVSMQGRTLYDGVPAVLTMNEAFPWGPYEATSIDQGTDNLVFTEVAGGSYLVTTNQPRYLNVTSDLGKSLSITADRSISALVLRGGNAQWSDNIINVGDAGVIGAAYGIGDINSDGDVNYDGAVNILDMAIMGGNFYLTSATAYSAWVP